MFLDTLNKLNSLVFSASFKSKKAQIERGFKFFKGEEVYMQRTNSLNFNVLWTFFTKRNGRLNISSNKNAKENNTNRSKFYDLECDLLAF